jgi:hypothetical protein
VLGDDDEAAHRLATVIDSLPPAPGRHVDTVAHALCAVVETSRGNADAGRAALAVAIERVRRRYGHIPSAWGVPVVAAGGWAIEGAGRGQYGCSSGPGRVGASGRCAEPTYAAPLVFEASRAKHFPAEFTAWAKGEQLSTDD